jgi:heme exporter protein D
MFEKATIFASILASAMFSAMILDLKPDTIPNGTEDEVRTWAASGAILFVILVLLCTGCSLGLKYHAETVASMYANQNRLVGFGLALGTLLFHGLLLSGTMFFCLVVKAYAPAIGWTAFGITALCALICFGVWAWELKGEILEQVNREKTRKQDADELAAFAKGGSDVPPKDATLV